MPLAQVVADHLRLAHYRPHVVVKSTRPDSPGERYIVVAKPEPDTQQIQQIVIPMPLHARWTLGSMAARIQGVLAAEGRPDDRIPVVLGLVATDGSVVYYAVSPSLAACPATAP